MKKLITLILVTLTSLMVSPFSADAQFSNSRDLHFYDNEFDWHWDVRVRISDGVRNGLLTNWERNRLYRRLERIEEKEYAYMADGNYTPWEQDDVWSDIVWLNRRLGLELYDNDRRFYGFNSIHLGFNNYPFWFNRWYTNGFNFYRYDRLGFGNFYGGYNPCWFVPRNQVIVRNNNVVINRNVYNTNRTITRRAATAVRNRRTVGTRPSGNRVASSATRRASTYGTSRTRSSTYPSRRSVGTTNRSGRSSSVTRPSSSNRSYGKVTRSASSRRPSSSLSRSATSSRSSSVARSPRSSSSVSRPSSARRSSATSKSTRPTSSSRSAVSRSSRSSSSSSTTRSSSRSSSSRSSRSIR